MGEDDDTLLLSGDMYVYKAAAAHVWLGSRRSTCVEGPGEGSETHQQLGSHDPT